MNEKMRDLDDAITEAVYAHAEGMSAAEVVGVLEMVKYAVMEAQEASKRTPYTEGYS